MGLYTRGGERLARLKAKRLVYVKTGCRDGRVTSHRIRREIKTRDSSELVEEQEVAGASRRCARVKAADAVFCSRLAGARLAKASDAGRC